MSKYIVDLADCAKHHVAIPKFESTRMLSDWECPYCRIAELKAENERLRICKTCGQDKRIAEIGERFGYRADIMAVEVRKQTARADNTNALLDELAREGHDSLCASIVEGIDRCDCFQRILAKRKESKMTDEIKRVPVEPVATVINNNQPGWTSIIETAPNVTLDVGTKLYAAPPADELARLEREIAIDCSISSVECIGMPQRIDGEIWFDIGGDFPNNRLTQVDYLEQHGLLERHSGNPNLVRIKESE